MSPGDNSVVYRAFDADNNLLYVGVTCDPMQRFGFHEYKTLWWHEVDRVELSQVFPKREDAEDAERLAIEQGQPLLNRWYPVVPESARAIELQFSPYDYKPTPNFPSVMRRLDSGSLVVQLPCPSCTAPSPDLMPVHEVLVLGDNPPEPFCTDPYHFPDADPEVAARVHANRDQLRQQGILRRAETPEEAAS